MLFGDPCKTDWQKVESPIVGLPKKLPNEYKTPLGVTVYCDRRPTALENQLIEQGIAEQLIRSHRDQNWDTPSAWREFKDFNYPWEYNVWLLDGDVIAKSPDIAGCPILNTKQGTACGTVGGYWWKKGKWQGTPIILVTKLSNQAIECQRLLRNCVDHESEHVRLLNNQALFTFFSGANDIHPLFK